MNLRRTRHAQTDRQTESRTDLAKILRDFVDGVDEPAGEARQRRIGAAAAR